MENDTERTTQEDQHPSLLQKLTLTGALWGLRVVLRDLLHEQREHNRLTRLHIRALTQSPNIITALDPTAPAPRAARAEGEFDGEIFQPTNAHYADLQDQFNAARRRGEEVDMGTDPTTLGDPERTR